MCGIAFVVEDVVAVVGAAMASEELEAVDFMPGMAENAKPIFPKLADATRSSLLESLLLKYFLKDCCGISDDEDALPEGAAEAEASASTFFW